VWFAYSYFKPESTAVAYKTTVVTKGSLVYSISGSGQVASLSEVEIQPKVSGEVTKVNVAAGDKVEEGAVIVQVDTGEASRDYSDALASWEAAKLELEELLAPVDDYDLMQAENSLTDAEDSLTKLKLEQATNYQQALEDQESAVDDLEKSYEDAYNDVSDAFLDFPSTMMGVYSVLYGEEIADDEPTVANTWNETALVNSTFIDYRTKIQNLVDDAEAKYADAREKYDDNFDVYREVSRYSDKDVIENLLIQTIETTKAISDTVKSEMNLLDTWVEYRQEKSFDTFSQVTTFQNSLNSYTSQVNSHLSSLLSAQQSIKDCQSAQLNAERSIAEMKINDPLELAQAERSVAEKERSLEDLQAGATELEIKNKQISVQQKYNSLLTAQESYNNCFVKAPFAGTIASLDISKGDEVSTSTSVATIITEQQMASIPLNEIDAGQVAVGQQVVLEFDAIDDFSMTGEVVAVDAIGTVSQGVVSYNVDILFDVIDSRVKSGMSVTASIIIASARDALLIPASAVNEQNGVSYVQVLTNGQPEIRVVTVGITDDVSVEVLTGLTEGEEVITNSATVTTTTSTSGDSRQFGPGGGDMGGMMMMVR